MTQRSQLGLSELGSNESAQRQTSTSAVRNITAAAGDLARPSRAGSDAAAASIALLPQRVAIHASRRNSALLSSRLQSFPAAYRLTAAWSPCPSPACSPSRPWSHCPGARPSSCACPARRPSWRGRHAHFDAVRVVAHVVHACSREQGRRERQGERQMERQRERGQGTGMG